MNYEQHKCKQEYEKTNVRENRITVHLVLGCAAILSEVVLRWEWLSSNVFLSVHKEFCPCCCSFTCCVVLDIKVEFVQF